MVQTYQVPELAIFPETARIDDRGHLTVGGCDVSSLAMEYGTPLYIFDEATLRNRCSEYRREFCSRYPSVQVLYASKAYLNRALAVLFEEEGLGLDVVSGGEFGIARSVGFPASRVHFHGNNKSAGEIDQAVAAGIGRIIIDNFHELGLVEASASKAGKVQEVMLRLSPGVDAHTHGHTTTGIVDSKFGFPIVTGQAEEALRKALASSHLDLIGLHTHLGSPIYEMEPYQEAIGIVLEFAARMRDRHGFEIREFSPGGGFAIQYTVDKPAPCTGEYAEVISGAIKEGCQHHGLPLPRLVIEPGRSIVGRAGVALYSVGATKDIPSVRKYVSLDGGMADNIRPAIYGSRYEALVANKALAKKEERVTLAGKYCESGDILIKDIDLPPLSPMDIVAIPASGAYCLSMASNYNASLRPPILLLKEGKARLIRRRETVEDLTRCDVV